MGLSAPILLAFVFTLASLLTSTQDTELYLPTIFSRVSAPLYASKNLTGHQLFAECNPGGATGCACTQEDVALDIFPGYGEVTSNPRGMPTYVNAIAFKKFTDTLPNNQPITLQTYTYAGEFSLVTVPIANPAQSENGQAAHMMIQIWDGRNALNSADKHTLEGTIYWHLNRWVDDYGKILIYTHPLNLVDTGIVLVPDTNWHTFELTVDLATQTYRHVTIDGQQIDLSAHRLASVHQPDWNDDLFLSITTESLAASPGENCEPRFTFPIRFRNLTFDNTDGL